MFEVMLPEPADLRGAEDAALISALRDYTRTSAASDARALAVIAELQSRREPDVHPEWACDDWDAVAAEIGAAVNIGHGRALGKLELAITLRDRLPKVGALFLAGQLNARAVTVIDARTALVEDDDALAQLDAAIADRAVQWGPLSDYKLTQALDVWVDRIDPGAVRRTRSSAQGRDVVVGDRRDGDGITSVAARLDATDAALLDQRLGAMARNVCEDDPRTLAQRRADGLGALGAGSTHLACRCENPACEAATDDGRASSIIVHVLTEQSTATTEPATTEPAAAAAEAAATEPPVATSATAGPTRRKSAGLIVGAVGGIVPAPLLTELLAHGAKLAPMRPPGCDPEPRYRPSKALDTFVRMRDLTCRYPGCDRPATSADLDHTVPHPAGHTHAGNLKCYCRLHHLLKTFWDGFSDHQLPDGTLLITTPAGLTYTTKPVATLLFPGWDITTPVPPSHDPRPESSPARTLMMPRRKQTRAKARQYRIKAERALNDAHVAERNIPPPF